jgi:UPF0288 family protein (methanogenesis marker protein 3)
MKEYLIRLDIEPYQMIILALNFEEAREIAYEKYGIDHVVQIVLHNPIIDMLGGYL